jgi:kynurenine formamidase
MAAFPPRAWVLWRTDWSKRSVEDYVNRRADGAHTPGPSAEAVRFLVEERDAHGFGVETIGTMRGRRICSIRPTRPIPCSTAPAATACSA